MDFVSVAENEYVLINDAVFSDYAAVLLIGLIVVYTLCLHSLNRKLGSYFFLVFLLCLSLFFSDNGPDKGSYAKIFHHLSDLRHIFSTLNTVEAPLYYAMMVCGKLIGLGASHFFLLQNVAISFGLYYISKAHPNGLYFALWLYFVHLLVPFSVRSHLLVCIVPFINSASSFSRLVMVFSSLGVHFFSAIFPALVVLRKYLSGFRAIVFAILFFVFLFLLREFVLAKIFAYTYDSDSYVKVEGLNLHVFFELFELYIFLMIVRNESLQVRTLAFLPIIFSVSSVFVPMLGRFAFSLDLMCILIAIGIRNHRVSRYLLLTLVFLSYIRFAKNFVSLEYYLL